MLSLISPFLVGAIELENPLEYDSFGELFGAILNFIMWLAIALMPIAVLIAAFNLIGAGDNPEKVQTAKNILKWAIIGLAIVLSARALYAVIMRVIVEGDYTIEQERRFFPDYLTLKE